MYEENLMRCLPLSPQEKTKRVKGKCLLQRLPFLCFSPHCVPNNGICSCCSLVPPSSVFSNSCENLWFLNPKVMFNTEVQFGRIWICFSSFFVFFPSSPLKIDKRLSVALCIVHVLHTSAYISAIQVNTLGNIHSRIDKH